MPKKQKIKKFKTKTKSKEPKLKTESEFEEEINKGAKHELEKIRDESYKILEENPDLPVIQRLKKVEAFAKREMERNRVLQQRLQMQSKKSPAKVKTMKDRARQNLRKIEAAYIEYYQDINSKVYSWIPLHSTPALIINRKKQEVFLLDHPTKFLNGKPVYIFIRGIPFSIPMEFRIDELHEQMEEMNNNEMKDTMPDLPNLPKHLTPTFGRIYLNSMDCYALYTSVQCQLLLGNRRSKLKSFAVHAFSFLLGVLTLYLFVSPYLWGVAG